MSKKPIIGITLDHCIDGPGAKYSEYPWYALRGDYAKIVAESGGIPLHITYEHNLIDDVLSTIDGLIIPGGDGDVPPNMYGQEVKSSKVCAADLRAEYEFELMTKALKRDMSILGICHGMQLLNVIFGGTLIQDIPEFVPHAISHKQPSPKNIPYHPMTINEGTKLFEIAGGKKDWMVTSTHHQAIDRLGSGLVASAIAPDGIVEAIESPEHRFVLGVEWHPEYGSTELDRNIFRQLILSLD